MTHKKIRATLHECYVSAPWRTYAHYRAHRVEVSVTQEVVGSSPISVASQNPTA
ncbi:MAG TPA: hypothetical protein VKF82_04980 [Candidatus Eremiobacteraceae bacterium]|nr:hypothetical protein [Candidatus Eremiobacteraceae bacterium]